MTFHMAAFFEEVGAAGTNVEVSPVNDNVLGISDNGFLLQESWSLIFAAAFQDDGLRARLSTPDFRQICLPHILPFNATLLPASRAGIANYTQQPLALPALANLKIEASCDATGGDGTYGVGLMKQYRAAPAGNILTLRLTGSTTVTADVWSDVTLTPEFNVPAGYYELVGMKLVSTTGILARAIIENQVERPGCIGGATIGIIEDELFRKGRLGSWGRFNSTRLPMVQVLCNAADTAQEVFMDIIKVG